MGISLSKIENINKKERTVPVSKGILEIEISFRRKRINDTRKEEFYSEVFLLLQSGLDLKGSIEIFYNQQKDERVKKIFRDIEEKLIKGSSFSDSLKDFPEFSPYEYYSIKIGEESGHLSEVLLELGNFYQRKIKQQKQLISAFTYPSVILLTAVIAIAFMMNFIVPLFADAFKRFNTNLPGLTLLIVHVSEFFRNYWWLLILLFTGMAVAVYWIQKIQSVRDWLGENVVKIPFIGELLQKIYLARFCQSMALMIAARNSLIVSLDLVSKMVGYFPLTKALIEVSQEIYRGKMLNEAMSSKKIFDSRMISLIKVGEETNKLEAIFKKLYEQYSGEADHRITIMNSLLEPLLIVFVGCLVAVILIAMYLPMFKIGNSMF